MNPSTIRFLAAAVAATAIAPAGAGVGGVAWRAALLVCLASLAPAHPDLALALVFVGLAHRAWLQRRRLATRRQLGVAPGATVVGFFHPFCASGGGGERVLWKMLHTLSEQHAAGLLKVHVVVYAAPGEEDWATVLAGASRRFGIHLSGGAARAAERKQQGAGTGARESEDSAAGSAADSACESQESVMAIDCVTVPRSVVRLLTAEAWPRFTMVRHARQTQT
jgi:hypothetical protein